MTTVTYIEGDATAPRERPAVIVHICNDIGGWGAGFVLAVSKRWRLPEQTYRAAFANGNKLGAHAAHRLRTCRR